MTTELKIQDTAESEVNRLEIDHIVSQLRALRVASLEHRQRLNKPPKLPSRKTLASIIERLSAALFPNRLGTPSISDEGIDYYVGHTLDVTLRDLIDQIHHELFFVSGQETAGPSIREHAASIANTFAKQLPKSAAYWKTTSVPPMKAIRQRAALTMYWYATRGSLRSFTIASRMS